MDPEYVFALMTAVVTVSAVAAGIIFSFSYVFRSFTEIYAYRRKMEWKKKILAAWRR